MHKTAIDNIAISQKATKNKLRAIIREAISQSMSRGINASDAKDVYYKDTIVLGPEGDVIGIVSGGNYALAAAKVLMDTELKAEEVAKKAIQVAADICVFTNHNIRVEKI